MIHDHSINDHGVIDGHKMLSVCSRRIADLYDLWDSKRAGRLLPSRCDFDIADLKPWLGWIALVDVLPNALPDGHDFKYRLVGSKFVRFHCSDPTGKLVSEVPFAITPKVMIKNLNDICVSRTPRYRHDAIQCVDPKTYTPPRIYLPLSDNDESVTVIMILGDNPLDADGNKVVTPHLRPF